MKKWQFLIKFSLNDCKKFPQKFYIKKLKILSKNPQKMPINHTHTQNNSLSFMSRCVMSYVMCAAATIITAIYAPAHIFILITIKQPAGQKKWTLINGYIKHLLYSNIVCEKKWENMFCSENKGEDNVIMIKSNGSTIIHSMWGERRMFIIISQPAMKMRN